MSQRLQAGVETSGRMCRTQTPTTSETYWEDLVFTLEVEKSFQNQGWLPILA